MANLPKRIMITEEGPREGFQIEKAPITTERKIELIDALSKTGLKHIVTVSFVNPKLVPQMADAEQVVAGFKAEPGVTYSAIALNARGVERALATKKLTVFGQISLVASPAFLARNQNSTPEANAEEQVKKINLYKEHGITVDSGAIGAAFGCNFQGDVSVEGVVGLVKQLRDIAAGEGVKLKSMLLADTMAWATPLSIKRVVGALQDAYPDLEYGLHLHDTRGLAVANAFAGLEMGVAYYDAAVAGLGGCPFAGHAGAAGNVCTEDLVFMCDEMGIETGIDLEALIECARLAEDIVGHPLPGSVMRGGSLQSLRQRLKAA